MTDILDELRSQALRQGDTPAPEGARERAVEVALGAFDEAFAADEGVAKSATLSRMPSGVSGDRGVRDRWIQFGRYGLAASLAAIVSAITLLILSNTPEVVDERPLHALDPNDVLELPLPDLREAMGVLSAGTDRFPRARANGVTDTLTDPVSTFSVDVDTASYTVVRRLINEGTLPPPEAVRTEEILNYFSYAYEEPEVDTPLNADVALMPAPWSDDVQLLRIGIQGYEPPAQELNGALLTIARDVKIQVEFNPTQVAEYRLLGYETGAPQREDSADDRVDAGEVGAGHQVTAMYEILAPGSEGQRLDPLRSRGAEAAADAALGDELAVVRIRYKAPGEDGSRRLDFPVTREAEVAPDTGESREVAFAAAVAAFGQKLRADPRLSDYDYGSVMALAEANGGTDVRERREFVRLVQLADELSR